MSRSRSSKPSSPAARAARRSASSQRWQSGLGVDASIAGAHRRSAGAPPVGVGVEPEVVAGRRSARAKRAALRDHRGVVGAQHARRDVHARAELAQPPRAARRWPRPRRRRPGARARSARAPARRARSGCRRSPPGRRPRDRPRARCALGLGELAQLVQQRGLQAREREVEAPREGLALAPRPPRARSPREPGNANASGSPPRPGARAPAPPG